MAKVEIKKFTEYNDLINDMVYAVDSVYLAGITVVGNLYLHFDVLIESKLYRIIFTIIPEYNEEYDVFETLYTDIPPLSLFDITQELTGVSKSLVAISSFKKFKDKFYKQDEYSIFCEAGESTVFEVLFSKAQFLYISSIIDKILNVDYDIDRRTGLNILALDTEEINTIRVSEPVEVVINDGDVVEIFVDKPYLNKRVGAFQKAPMIPGAALVPCKTPAFGDDKIYLILPLPLRRQDYKNHVVGNDRIHEFDLRDVEDIVKEKSKINPKTYLLLEYIKTQYGRKSDYPMQKITMIMTDAERHYLYIDLPTTTFDELCRSVSKAIFSR